MIMQGMKPKTQIMVLKVHSDVWSLGPNTFRREEMKIQAWKIMRKQKQKPRCRKLSRCCQIFFLLRNTLPFGQERVRRCMEALENGKGASSIQDSVALHSENATKTVMTISIMIAIKWDDFAYYLEVKS
ncbi:hypothetical protein RIF29_28346 [Crotalaria pallida]|uniref:Uncharacterized protein n=1 Tax=Crotalaria pallida TaxID=3830 RepID=A0AAN9ERT3_CROPI